VLLFLTIGALLLVVFAKACGGGAGADLVSYVDTARTYIQRSNDIGKRFQALPGTIGSFNRADLTKALDSMARDAQVVADDAVRLFTKVPPPALAAHGYLLSSLKARASGLVDIKPAILGAPANPDEGIAIDAFRNQLLGLILSDVSYGYFSSEIKAQLDKVKQRSEVPPSTYVKDTSLGQPNPQADFVRAIRASDKLKPSQDVAIVDVSTKPAKLASDSSDIASLPAADAFELDVTVANMGNVQVKSIQVKAALVSDLGTQESASTEIDQIDPGDKKIAAIYKLNPDRGDPRNRIDVEVGGVDNADPIDSRRTFQFRMAK
jgi:hypothetical protein